MKKVFLLLTIIGFVTFTNSLNNSFVLDDDAQITQNLLVHSLSNLPLFFSGSTFYTGGAEILTGNYYRPLMTTYFSFMYTFFGANTFPYHLVQTLVHIVNATLVFVLFKKFFTKQLSLFLAILFLVHPINQEAVVYISDMADHQFFFFGLVALLLSMDPKSNWKKDAVTILLLILSLLSKEAGIIYAPLIIIASFVARKRQSLNLNLTIIVITICYLIFRFFILQQPSNINPIFPMMNLGLWQRLLSLPAIFFYYLSTLVIPNNLATHQLWVVKSVSFSNFYLPLLASIIFVLILFLLGLRIYTTRRKDLWVFIIFSGFFFLGISPYLQLIPLEMTVETSWFYFPFVGILGMLGLAVQNIKINNRNILTAVYFFSVAIIIFFSIRTIQRNVDWNTKISLYSKDIQSEDNFAWENNLGDALFKNGDYNKAKFHFDRSIKMNPYWSNLYNLGAVNFKLKNNKEAINYMEKSLNHGDYYLAYENLSYILILTGDVSRSESVSSKALKKLPQNATLWFLNGLAKYQLNKRPEGIAALRQSISLDSTRLERQGVLNAMIDNRQINIKE